MNNFISEVEKEAKKFGVALDDFPEFSAQLGVLVSCFALIEDYVFEVFVACTGMKKPEAFYVLGSFSSYGGRIDLLENLLKTKEKKSDQYRAVKYFLKTFKEAASIRNHYVHGKYSLTFRGVQKEKVMIITSYLYDAKRKKPIQKEKGLQDIETDVERLKFIICELHGYIYRQEMPILVE